MEIEDKVIEKIKERQKVGLKKYGKSVADNPLSTLEWLNHLQEELLDGAIYVERLKAETAKAVGHNLLVSEKFAEALEEVKRIIDRMDIDIFDNESVGKDAYYQIHTSINEAKRQINEVISKFSR